MEEPEQQTAINSTLVKKDRSPSFPFITLTKSIERARELFAAARRHEMRLSDAAAAMGYRPKSSGAIQTLAALIAFGLVEDSGSGEARKFRVTDLAFKALEDQRPGARHAALAEAALLPKMISEYADKWKDGRPADGICISELRIDGGFTEDGAKAFLRVFDDALSFAKVGDPDKEAGKEENALPKRDGTDIGVGDFVRVESNGQIIYEKSRVRAIDGPWVFVEASQSAANISDVTLLDKAAVASTSKPPILPFAQQEIKTEAGEEMDRFTVDEGVVKIAYPTEMSVDSVEELEQFFQLFIKKAKRRAGSEKS